MLRGIPCTLMRGGTSKGLFFNAADLPADPRRRDAILLAAMGSPDPRQIDGLGGAHPLTSKAAIIAPSSRGDADVDYLFLQVAVDRAEVSDSQTCGNLLAAVGPWAIENGLAPAQRGVTSVRIHMVNSGALAVARVETPDGAPEYEGDARIDGAPGTAAPILLDFLDIAGSSCGALLPTGNVVDEIDGVAVTCIDNGMPVVLLDAAQFGVTGAEAPADLEANLALASRIERLRLALGPLMRLGDVAKQTVPKMCLTSPPCAGGAVNTRTFIPHRVHEAIGVLGAVSVATACMLPGSVVSRIASTEAGPGPRKIDVEHPTGSFTVEVDIDVGAEGLQVRRASLLRTARKLMRGEAYVPAALLRDAP